MPERRLGIIVSGATSRMARTQHLPALMAMREERGLPLKGGDRLIPDIFLHGRDSRRLQALAQGMGIERYTTDLDAVLSDPAYEVFFDTALTQTRPMLLSKAIDAGKHIYAEKPVAHSVEQGLTILRAAENRGLKHGAVEDKLHMPGINAVRDLRQKGFFGRITKFHLEFGYWVYDGENIPCQRSSWNYRKDQHGGIMLDMFPHWRYVIEDLFGRISELASSSWTAMPERVDESGALYEVDVEDTGVCMMTLENGIRGSAASSWATRLRHDRFSLHIDGTEGSADASFSQCFVQPAAKPVPGGKGPVEAPWSELTLPPQKNNYRIAWEEFLRHVAEDAPLKSDLRAGIRDVQFGELNRRSVGERRWVAFPA